MHFLVDESCDAAMTRVLLEGGHDVMEIRKIKPGADDKWVINLAISEKRILLTEDKDFGRLIYAHGYKAIGVELHAVETAKRCSTGAINPTNSINPINSKNSIYPINSTNHHF